MNSRIAGMWRIAGEVVLRSQLVIVASETPIWVATCVCKSLRSKRRLRMWSPKLLIFIGYSVGFGFASLICEWQKGNAGMPVRILRRSHARMPLHAAANSALREQDLRAAARSDRYSHR